MGRKRNAEQTDGAPVEIVVDEPTSTEGVPVDIVVDEPTSTDKARARLAEFVARGDSFAKVAKKALAFMDEESDMHNHAKDARKQWRKRLRNLEKVAASMVEDESGN